MSHRHECPASPDGLHSFAWPRGMLFLHAGKDGHWWECHWCDALTTTDPQAPVVHRWPERDAEHESTFAHTRWMMGVATTNAEQESE